VLASAPLSARLVVLSGCETGLGRELAGEGLLGLAHAFLGAGADALLVSLAPVADRATAQLMVPFYRRLFAGETVATALAGAQRELLRERDGRRHPFHWAPFAILGDGRVRLAAP
jgi:CHAT domain-containing protein